MTEEKTKTNEKDQVLKTIEGFFAALGGKDIRAMMSYYAAEVIVFDVKPPFQTKGAVTWRHAWEACLPYFPDQFKIEMRDTVIHASGNLAFAHYLFRITGPEKDHPAMQTWIRATTGLKKLQDKWKIVHEHGSLPYNPHTLKVWFTLEPDKGIPFNGLGDGGVEGATCTTDLPL